MRLFELAYACRLYAHLAGFDRPLQDLRTAVGPVLDPTTAEHRVALFKWLNAWGCRQFAIAHHASTASESLVEWAAIWMSQLPDPGARLTDLTQVELSVVAEAYEHLRDAKASLRSLSDGRSSSVSYGPTGAAKALFALRPSLVPPWDDPIRMKLGFDSTASGFLAYLGWVAVTLRALADEAGTEVHDLPALIGRPGSSPPKLIDEYNWVVLTRGCMPPTSGELALWANWAPGADGTGVGRPQPLSRQGRT